MQGTWRPVKGELAGKTLGKEILDLITLRIHDNKYEVTVKGESKTDQGSCRLDTQSMPKGMVIKGEKGPNEGKTFQAIYRFHRDELIVCYDLSGKQRPKQFKSTAGTMLYLVTYRRPATPKK